ncbi:MAG TPA: hypothetical protein PKW30_03850 [Campylobacterales bacterium]|nr:hypothetical protein [Campylobacterales bacterium]
MGNIHDFDRVPADAEQKEVEVKQTSNKPKWLAGLIAGGVIASNAMAAGALTVNPLATDDFVAVAGAVLVAGAVMWSIRKALRLIGA